MGSFVVAVSLFCALLCPLCLKKKNIYIYIIYLFIIILSSLIHDHALDVLDAVL